MASKDEQPDAPSITSNITHSEFVTLQARLAAGLSRWSSFALPLTFVVQPALAAIAIFGLQQFTEVKDSTIALVFIPLAFVSYLLLQRGWFNFYLKTAESRGLPASMISKTELSESGVLTTMDNARTYVPWSAISRLLVLQREIGLVTGMMAAGLVRAHFASKEDEARFIAYAFARMSEEARARSKEAGLIAATAERAGLT